MKGKDILAVDARNEKILETKHLENITGRSSDIPDKYQDGAEFTTANLENPQNIGEDNENSRNKYLERTSAKY